MGKFSIIAETENYGIAFSNPILYRGYYYDWESGLYYLNARYYDPNTGRFISPDSTAYLDPDAINGLNLYAYCGNNPVMRTDSTGSNWWTDFWNSTIGKIVGTLLVIAVVVAISIVTAGVGTAITGALGGGFIASILGGAVGGAISGAVIGAGFSMVSQGISVGYGNINWGKVGIDTLIGAGTGAIMGALFAAGGRALGLLGKTNWAKRTVDFSKSNNFLFGSESGNFTLLRHGTKFRIEASIQHGIHMHYQSIKNGAIVVGRSVPRTGLINFIWNTFVSLTTSTVRQFS